MINTTTLSCQRMIKGVKKRIKNGELDDECKRVDEASLGEELRNANSKVVKDSIC